MPLVAIALLQIIKKKLIESFCNLLFILKRKQLTQL